MSAVTPVMYRDEDPHRTGGTTGSETITALDVTYVITPRAVQPRLPAI